MNKIKKFLRDVWSCIKKAPKKIEIKYKKWILASSKKTTTKHCKMLQSYAIDVLGRGIDQYNFEETKFMFLEYAEHRIRCEKIIGIGIETFFTFILAVVYSYVSESDIIKAAAGNTVIFVIFFFGIFYIPRKLKEWFYDKTRNTKGIDKLTFDVYKIYVNK